MAIPIVAVVGWHNAGKTTFIERLVAELKRRGLRVATIKHSREDIELDRPGTDTFRFAQAGSDVIGISGRHRMALIERRETEMGLGEIVARLPEDLDLIILEGYKQAKVPKIEVIRAGVEGGRISTPEELLALIVDEPVDEGERIKCFASTDVPRVADFLEAQGLIVPKNG